MSKCIPINREDFFEWLNNCPGSWNVAIDGVEYITVDFDVWEEEDE